MRRGGRKGCDPESKWVEGKVRKESKKPILPWSLQRKPALWMP